MQLPHACSAMPSVLGKFLIVAAGFSSALLMAAETLPANSEGPTGAVHERVCKTLASEQPTITLMLRTLRERARGEAPPKAVVAICTWESEHSLIRARIMDQGFPPVAYAVKHDLPILTWNAVNLWDAKRSYYDLTREEQKHFDQEFDRVAAAWEMGVTKLCREVGVPSDRFLLYGISRGAHWSQRLVLRRPKRFLAAHIHVAGSYDKPTQRGSSTLWLVSTGDLDGGHAAARLFYDRVMNLGYPAIFKQYRGLAHADCPALYVLQEAVFDFALSASEKANSAWKTKSSTATTVAFEALAEQPYCGDFLNESVVPKEKSNSILVHQRIPLPSKEVAEAWGRLRE